MKYIYKFLPFLKSNVIGIISKICLIYTTVFLGLLGGILGVLLGAIFLFDQSTSSIYAIKLLLGGVSFILFYIYTIKGYNLKSPKLINKSYITLGIGFFMWFGLLGGIVNWLLFGIPLIKTKNAFEKAVSIEFINNN